jgi:hypothetical protein
MRQVPWATRTVAHPKNHPNGTVVYQGKAAAEEPLSKVIDTIVAANDNFGRFVQEIKVERRIKSYYD